MGTHGWRGEELGSRAAEKATATGDGAPPPPHREPGMERKGAGEFEGVEEPREPLLPGMESRRRHRVHRVNGAPPPLLDLNERGGGGEGGGVLNKRGMGDYAGHLQYKV
ncbi:hypothetical protein E2562_034132 [Oryza meyeriana var. granulata]|uniref:Uncharacterized protein n=1 Tax=Oryza meyeriana var. granulata TaxID=110450 RepID=A0A6G1E5A5_9ORYZ|nr:hypothetical protein E2562_034132 [Oryza meyeriana var. granulata]